MISVVDYLASREVETHTIASTQCRVEAQPNSRAVRIVLFERTAHPILYRDILQIGPTAYRVTAVTPHHINAEIV